MTPLDLLKLLRDQPFQPFRLHLSNGTTYTINHPELAAVGVSVLRLYVPAQSGLPLASRVSVIALLHIVEAEFPAGNIW
jgi:hypothetical protein